MKSERIDQIDHTQLFSNAGKTGIVPEDFSMYKGDHLRYEKVLIKKKYLKTGAPSIYI